jgi:hypothetical protein
MSHVRLCLRARVRPLRFGLQNAVLGLSNTSAPHLDFQHFGLSLLSGLGIEQLFRVIVVVEHSKGK